MKKDLPIYDIKLSDDTQGVGFISLVDEPAIGVDWIKLAKQEVEEPVELFMSLTDNGLCFGCPPNGDGTKVNGEPDGRCKGDSAGGSKGGGSKSGGAGKVSAPKAEEPVKDTATSIPEGLNWDENGIAKVDEATAKEMLDGRLGGYSAGPNDEFSVDLGSDGTVFSLDMYDSDARKYGLNDENYGVSDWQQTEADLFSGDKVQLSDDEYNSLLFKMNNSWRVRGENEDIIEKTYVTVKDPNDPNKLKVQFNPALNRWKGNTIFTIDTQNKTIERPPHSIDRETGKPVRVTKDMVGTTKRYGVNFDNGPFLMEVGGLLPKKRKVEDYPKGTVGRSKGLKLVRGGMPKVKYKVTKTVRGGKGLFSIRPHGIW